MKDGVRLTQDGRPEGFLHKRESFETVRFEVVDGMIGLLTLSGIPKNSSRNFAGS